MNNKQIYLKYLATVSSLALLINMLLIYLDDQKTIFNHQSITKWVVISICLLIGIVTSTIYWVCKSLTKRNTEFNYTKKDNYFFYAAMSMYGLNLGLVILFNFLSLTIQRIDICFYIIVSLSLLASITGSILELFSRINYQAYLNRQFYQQAKQARKARIEAAITSNQPLSKSDLAMLVNHPNRTKQGQEILEKDLTKKNYKEKYNPFDED